MSSLKEADIVRAILRYRKSVSICFCWKELGGLYGTAGIPDVIACIGGRFFAFEVKTEEGKATALQESVLRKIQKCGGIAAIVRSVEEVKECWRRSRHDSKRIHETGTKTS